MAAKYIEYFQDMLENHKEIFDSFQLVHDNYVLNPEKFQKEFNEKGEEVLAIIRRYENMLCGRSEGTGYGKFSSKLSDKFWEVVRKTYPKIDFVGIQ